MGTAESKSSPQITRDKKHSVKEREKSTTSETTDTRKKLDKVTVEESALTTTEQSSERGAMSSPNPGGTVHSPESDEVTAVNLQKIATDTTGINNKLTVSSHEVVNTSITYSSNEISSRIDKTVDDKMFSSIEYASEKLDTEELFSSGQKTSTEATGQETSNILEGELHKTVETLSGTEQTMQQQISETASSDSTCVYVDTRTVMKEAPQPTVILPMADDKPEKDMADEKTLVGHQPTSTGESHCDMKTGSKNVLESEQVDQSKGEGETSEAETYEKDTDECLNKKSFVNTDMIDQTSAPKQEELVYEQQVIIKESFTDSLTSYSLDGSQEFKIKDPIKQDMKMPLQSDTETEIVSSRTIEDNNESSQKKDKDEIIIESEDKVSQEEATTVEYMTPDLHEDKGIESVAELTNDKGTIRNKVIENMEEVQTNRMETARPSAIEVSEELQAKVTPEQSENTNLVDELNYGIEAASSDPLSQNQAEPFTDKESKEERQNETKNVLLSNQSGSVDKGQELEGTVVETGKTIDSLVSEEISKEDITFSVAEDTGADGAVLQELRTSCEDENNTAQVIECQTDTAVLGEEKNQTSPMSTELVEQAQLSELKVGSTANTEILAEKNEESAEASPNTNNQDINLSDITEKKEETIQQIDLEYAEETPVPCLEEKTSPGLVIAERASKEQYVSVKLEEESLAIDAIQHAKTTASVDEMSDPRVDNVSLVPRESKMSDESSEEWVTEEWTEVVTTTGEHAIIETDTDRIESTAENKHAKETSPTITEELVTRGLEEKGNSVIDSSHAEDYLTQQPVDYGINRRRYDMTTSKNQEKGEDMITEECKMLETASPRRDLSCQTREHPIKDSFLSQTLSTQQKTLDTSITSERVDTEICEETYSNTESNRMHQLMTDEASFGSRDIEACEEAPIDVNESPELPNGENLIDLSLKCVIDAAFAEVLSHRRGEAIIHEEATGERQFTRENELLLGKHRLEDRMQKLIKTELEKSQKFKSFVHEGISNEDDRLTTEDVTRFASSQYVDDTSNVAGYQTDYAVTRKERYPTTKLTTDFEEQIKLSKTKEGGTIFRENIEEVAEDTEPTEPVEKFSDPQIDEFLVIPRHSELSDESSEEWVTEEWTEVVTADGEQAIIEKDTDRIQRSTEVQLANDPTRTTSGECVTHQWAEMEITANEARHSENTLTPQQPMDNDRIDKHRYGGTISTQEQDVEMMKKDLKKAENVSDKVSDDELLNTIIQSYVDQVKLARITPREICSDDRRMDTSLTEEVIDHIRSVPIYADEEQVHERTIERDQMQFSDEKQKCFTDKWLGESVQDVELGDETQFQYQQTRKPVGYAVEYGLSDKEGKEENVTPENVLEVSQSHQTCTSSDRADAYENAMAYIEKQPQRVLTEDVQAAVLSEDINSPGMSEMDVIRKDIGLSETQFIDELVLDHTGGKAEVPDTCSGKINMIIDYEATLKRNVDTIRSKSDLKESAQLETIREVDEKIPDMEEERVSVIQRILEVVPEETDERDDSAIGKVHPSVQELIIQDDQILQFYSDQNFDSLRVSKDEICEDLRSGAISRLGYVDAPGTNALQEDEREVITNEGKMSQKKSVDGCLTWIENEQKRHETDSYGGNKCAVGEALTEQRRRVKLVDDYKREVDKVASSCRDKEEKEKLMKKYEALKETANKRLCCLEGMTQIAGMEEIFGTITAEFAERATSLVQDAATKKKSEPPEQDGAGIARAAQNCILAVRENWNWISKLVKCTDIHLKNTAEYHQFFHDIDEYGDWMPIELRKVTDLVADPGTQANREDASRLLLELKTVLAIFLHWQAKVEGLLEKAKKIVPIHQRARKLDHYRPVSSLCNYKTHDVNIREGEELTLLDNSKTQSWLVRNMHSDETWVPSIICLIPPPDPGAMEAAMKARLQLLTVWTLHLQRIGKTLIDFLLLVFRDWNKDEERQLKNLPLATKNEITRMVDFIEESLSRHWSEYPDFKTLKGRFDRLRGILAQDGDPNARAEDIDNEMGKALVVQIGIIEELMKRYQDLWRYWETYKVMVEISRNPEYLMIVEKWEDYKFLSIEELLSKWRQILFSDESGGSKISSMHAVEEVIEAEESGDLEAIDGMNGDSAGISTTIETSRNKAKSDTLSTSEQEEKKTFVITGVIDPRTDEEISLDQAVKLGIINQTTGTYVNPKTGESLPIPVAMNAGIIKVEFTTTKKSAEKRSDIGLITISTYRESRPYTVKGVVDAKTEKHLSIDEAIQMGVLDQNNAKYYNTESKEQMSFGDALDSGLLIVEFDKEAEVTEPEVVTKTYAIHAVVDQKRKRRVPFSEAVRMGLIDQQTGAYNNNTNDEQIYIGDAIHRGLIKATIVTDPNSMDIAPENKIVAEKVQNIRSKLLNPMKAMAALKKNAATNDDVDGTCVISSSEAGEYSLANLLAKTTISSNEGGRGICGRLCRSCLPLQMLLFLLLGVACLLPMSEEEFSCILANNFENSLSPMLKYVNGPPPS